MRIEETRVKEAFASYARNYNPEDEKVHLKIVHTYKVAELCRKIAESLSLAPEDVELAWLLGMLHDVGRFEQLRRYNTFNDADSIDHALFGAESALRRGTADPAATWILKRRPRRKRSLR